MGDTGEAEMGDGPKNRRRYTHLFHPYTKADDVACLLQRCGLARGAAYAWGNPWFVADIIE